MKLARINNHHDKAYHVRKEGIKATKYAIKEQENKPGAWHFLVPAYQKELGEAQQPLAPTAQPGNRTERDLLRQTKIEHLFSCK